MRQVTEETFLQVCECTWNHLRPAHTAVRATCRRGRLLHDRLLTRLRPSLVPRWYEGNGDAVPAAPPRPTSPEQLYQLVAGLLRRGTRLQALEMHFRPTDTVAAKGMEEGFVVVVPPQERETQLLTVLQACSSCPVTSIELYSGIPHTTVVAEAVAACCPQLTKLTLNYYCQFNDLPSSSWAWPTAEEYASGVVSLLQLVGPRLRELEVAGSAHQWAPQCFDALSHCTGLTSLSFNAGWSKMTDDGERVVVQSLDSADIEARLLWSVGTLTQLRSLHLRSCLHPDICSPDTMRPHARSLGYLSALTALTSLHLGLSDCYQPAGDSWRRQQQDGEQHEAWEEVREVQRTSLLFALRAMPQLQKLDCRTLWLRPSEAASLTALTSLTLLGLLPPRPQPLSSRAPASGPLPPHLRTLTLTGDVSPSALAVLQPPPSLTELDASGIRFGMSDVSPAECRILPRAAEDFGSAMRLLTSLRPETHWGGIIVTGDCGPRPVGPPEAGPQGHTGWIRELAVVDTWLTYIKLEGVRLRVGDVACLVSAMPHLQGLELAGTHLTSSVLPALSGLRHLEDLNVDLTHCHHLTTEELEGALCVLCKEASRELQHVEVRTNSVLMNKSACCQAVEEQVEEWGLHTLSMSIFIR